MIRITAHSTQTLDKNPNGYDWDRIERRCYETAEAANAAIKTLLDEIEENWYMMFDEKSSIIRRGMDYIHCSLDGEPEIFEIYEIIEVDGVKIRPIPLHL